MFHQRTGSLVLLTHGNTRAQRINASQEFNNAIVFSAEPLRYDQLFEVKIERRVRTWSGNVEVGVTTQSPTVINIPASATDFSNGCWIMSGNSIVKSGRAVIENYGNGRNLEDLVEGDRVGVLRKRSGDIHFLVNGEDLGVAVSGLFCELYAIVDLYGKCAAVSIIGNDIQEEITGDINSDMRILSRYLAIPGREDCASTTSSTYESVGSRMWSPDVFSTAEAAQMPLPTQLLSVEQQPRVSSDVGGGLMNNETLRFHHRCGELIGLSEGNRCAERTRPLDEFNNGIVFTNRPLRPEEVFEIVLESVVDKWCGSVEIGVSSLNPNTTADLPFSMAHLPEGTIIMSGRSLSIKGVGKRREYGEFNLDDLMEGDRVGLKIKQSGDIHFYVNGIDQGCAVKNVGSNLFGIVDLYGMAAKVRIVDATVSSWATARHINFGLLDSSVVESRVFSSDPKIVTPLKFDDVCGPNAAIINNGQAAFRPNSSEQFENAVVFTNRPLEDGETFQVEIVRSIDKWAGSLEIGLMSTKPADSDGVPSSIMRFWEGCWYLMGDKVMLNGQLLKEPYGHRHLERLQKGDRIGVTRLPDGTLHFFVNGEDQGVAATDVPSGLYGVVDLCGQVVQIALVDMEIEETSTSLLRNRQSVDEEPNANLKFHQSIHGGNVVVASSGINVIRLQADDEFNNAVVISDRCLKRDEMIRIKIDRVITRWSGSLEVGLTTSEPSKYHIPVTLTESKEKLWLLCGSSLLTHSEYSSPEPEMGGTEYRLNLNLIQQGDVVGLKIFSDGEVHFFLNGIDQGAAWQLPEVEVFLLVDLYGQCVEVSLLPPSIGDESSVWSADAIDESSGIAAESEVILDETFVACDLLEIPHEFSTFVSSGVCLEMENQLARRTRANDKSLVWGKEPLKEGEEFEIKLESIKDLPSPRSFLIGFLVAKEFPTQEDLCCWNSLSAGMWGPFAFIGGHTLYRNGTKEETQNCCPSLDLLPVGSKVGCVVKKGGFVHLTVGGSDFGCVANGASVYVVVELAGRCEIISASSCHQPRNPKSAVLGTGETEKEDTTVGFKSDSFRLEDFRWGFSTTCGKQIEFEDDGKRAIRKDSFDHGLVFSQFPIQPHIIYHVRVDKVDCSKVGSAAIGILIAPLPTDSVNTVLNLRSSFSAFLINNLVVTQSLKANYSLDMGQLKEKDVVGVGITDDGSLHFYFNGVDRGIAAVNVPCGCHIVFDLYGPVQEISIVQPARNNLSVAVDKDSDREKADAELTGEDESLFRASLVWTIPDIRCEFANVCRRALNLLHIPDEYLETTGKCFCPRCLCAVVRIGKDSPTVAEGWYRHPIRLSRHNVVSAESLSSAKVRAFQGAKVHHSRRIFDAYRATYKSALANAQSSASSARRQLSSEEADVRVKCGGLIDLRSFVISPDITCATLPGFAPWFCFSDELSGKKWSFKVALEIWVNSGGYKVHTCLPPVVQSANRDLLGDPVPIYEAEQFWALRDNSPVLSAVLVKVVGE